MDKDDIQPDMNAPRGTGVRLHHSSDGNTVWIEITDADGEVIAGLIMPEESARAMARVILTDGAQEA